MNKILKYLVSLVIIIAVLLVGVFGYSKINPDFFSKSNSKEMVLTIEFEQIKKELLDNMKKGDTITESSQNNVFGKIETLSEIEDSIVTVSNYEDGKYIKATTSEYGRRVITVKSKANVTERDIKMGDIEIEVGKKFGFIFNNTLAEGTVMKIDISDNEEK